MNTLVVVYMDHARSFPYRWLASGAQMPYNQFISVCSHRTSRTL